MSTRFVLQSTCGENHLALHVAVIMDGNGRWAARRGLPRIAGHRAGAGAVRRVTEAARAGGLIRTLTLYAFSSDNWGRPQPEVDTLMGLFEEHLAVEARRCAREGIRLVVIGRRDRLKPSLLDAVARAERDTAPGRAMDLRLAVDYSSRDAILAAAGASVPGRGEFAQRLGEAMHAGGPAADVDLLIRTGGEQRLSDFLLWECAYAELYFTDRMWPDFRAADLDDAIAWFRARQRRFGRLPAAAPAGVPALNTGAVR
jgi:undecaprenyl diphosphate synthase